MKTVVSERGQITLPKSIRVSLGLKPGTILDISLGNGQFIGSKEEPMDPISRWRGRGHLPGHQTSDSYIAETRE